MPNYILRIGSPPVAPTNLTDWGDAVPLIDMGTAYTWHGLEGGLYSGATNTPPAGHVAAGQAAAALVEKLNAAGAPSGTGKIGIITIGMSNHKMEMCGANTLASCKSGSFMQRHNAGKGVTTNPDIVFANAANPGSTVDEWDEVTDARWATGVGTILSNVSLTDEQVQIALIKNVLVFGSISLPSPAALAYAERDGLEDCIDIAVARFPNLRQVFIWPRIYGGYSNGVTGQSPEPYAFESCYAVKFLVERFISGAKSYGGVWVGWGPYMWANGMTARSDGLTWAASEFGDTVHPTDAAIGKVGGLIEDFFLDDVHGLSPWYAL